LRKDSHRDETENFRFLSCFFGLFSEYSGLLDKMVGKIFSFPLL